MIRTHSQPAVTYIFHRHAMVKKIYSYEAPLPIKELDKAIMKIFKLRKSKLSKLLKIKPFWIEKHANQDKNFVNSY